MTSPFLATSCYVQHSRINTRFNKRIIALLVSTAIAAPHWAQRCLAVPPLQRVCRLNAGHHFLKGKPQFTRNGNSAEVSNAGVISVGRGGYAALMGGSVKNDGLINVPVGKVGLGAAEKATLDLSGDGFLQVAVPSTSGVKEALIQNNGTVSANGGAVIMTAATARNAVRNAINLSVVVEANSVGGQNGAITIGGGEGGNVAVSVTITATAAQGNGGKVNITGDSIVLTGAKVDVSGKTGGGTVNIGGERQGKGSTQPLGTFSWATTFDNALMPYAFGSLGTVGLSKPTALEQKEVHGSAYGVGLCLSTSQIASPNSAMISVEYARGKQSGEPDDDRVTLRVFTFF